MPYNLCAAIYIYYWFNKTKITQLTTDCEMFANEYSSDVKRFKKFLNYGFFITVILDFIAITRDPMDVLVSYMEIYLCTAPILLINIKHLLCCYCLNLVDRPMFKPKYTKRKANYLKIEEILWQSQDLTERINASFGVFPLICFVDLLIIVTYMVNHFLNSNEKIDDFIRFFDPCIFMLLLMGGGSSEIIYSFISRKKSGSLVLA